MIHMKVSTADTSIVELAIDDRLTSSIVKLVKDVQSHALRNEFETTRNETLSLLVLKERGRSLWRRKMVTYSKMLTETEYAKEIDGKKRNEMFRDGRLTLEHQTSSDTDETIRKTFSESLGERVVDIFLNLSQVPIQKSARETVFRFDRST